MHRIEFFPQTYAVFRLPAWRAWNRPGQPRPDWSALFDADHEFLTISQTPDELSIVATTDRQSLIERLIGVAFSDRHVSGRNPEDNITSLARVERGFCCFRVAESLDFNAIGIIAAISQQFANAQLPILSISTFDTDYFLVSASHRDTAKALLTEAGYRVAERS